MQTPTNALPRTNTVRAMKANRTSEIVVYGEKHSTVRCFTDAKIFDA